MHPVDTLPNRTIRRTYKYRLYPTRAQAEALDAQRRFACDLYNAALEQRMTAYRLQRKSISLYDQMRDLTELRHAGLGLPGMGSSAQRDPLRRLDRAFAAFYRRVKAGQTPGFPRFRSERRYDSLTWPWMDGAKLQAGRLVILGVGAVKVKWHREIPSEAAIKTMTAIRAGDRWYTCFSLEVPVRPAVRLELPSVGVDVGITTFAMLSTGEAIAGPRAARAAQRGLRVAQRRLNRRKRGSARRNKARLQVARCHEKVKNVRRDHAHKTARDLVSRFGTIYVEDLNIKGLAGGMLARDVHDQGWGLFLTLLTEKAECAARPIVKVNAWGTSQTCSACDAHAPKDLSVRWHSCVCGYEADRDVNAACNVLKRGLGSSLQALTIELVAPVVV